MKNKNIAYTSNLMELQHYRDKVFRWRDKSGIGKAGIKSGLLPDKINLLIRRPDKPGSH